VVIDLATNLQSSVKEKIYKKYPHALNLRYIAHTLNLIAIDLTKLHKVKLFIDQYGKIIAYFNKSHQKLALLQQELKLIKVRSEGLE
ncbi:41587_t:CDS:1, partial [Gigaspora margarita]